MVVWLLDTVLREVEMLLALFGKFVKVSCSLLLLVSLRCVPGCARTSGSKEEWVVGLCSQELHSRKASGEMDPVTMQCVWMLSVLVTGTQGILTEMFMEAFAGETGLGWTWTRGRMAWGTTDTGICEWLSLGLAVDSLCWPFKAALRLPFNFSLVFVLEKLLPTSSLTLSPCLSP